MDTPHNEFDFDTWAKLAENDPDAFEQARRAMLSSVIESAPEHSRRRLAGLQWQIDQVRERETTPMGSCIKIADMMWQNVLGNDGLLENLETLTGAREPKSPAAKPPAAVLPFLRPDS